MNENNMKFDRKKNQHTHSLSLSFSYRRHLTEEIENIKSTSKHAPMDDGSRTETDRELKRTQISKPENHDKFSTGFITRHYDPIWQLVQAVERNLINVSNFIIK